MLPPEESMKKTHSPPAGASRSACRTSFSQSSTSPTTAISTGWLFALRDMSGVYWPPRGGQVGPGSCDPDPVPATSFCLFPSPCGTSAGEEEKAGTGSGSGIGNMGAAAARGAVETGIITRGNLLSCSRVRPRPENGEKLPVLSPGALQSGRNDKSACEHGTGSS